MAARAAMAAIEWLAPGHHQPPRDPAGEVGAVVVFDDGQGKIGTSADPRTGDEGPVPDEQGVWFHHDVRVVPGKPRAVRPVGRGAAAVQQAETGQHEGTGAYRRDASGPRHKFADGHQSVRNLIRGHFLRDVMRRRGKGEIGSAVPSGSRSPCPSSAIITGTSSRTG